MLRKICYGILNKRGTVLVEATIYMPIIILTVVAVLSLSTQMYEKITIQTERHCEQRRDDVGKQADFARKVDFGAHVTDILK